jgi:hypothetical protein
MIHFRDETIIESSPERVFYFLTHINKLYKIWHPRDHVFCHVLSGSMEKENSIIHFFEWVGKFPLYLIAQTVKVKRNCYLEYVPVFPFSLLRLGSGSFVIEKVSKNKCKLIASADGGYNLPIVGPFLDFVAQKIISFDAIRKHMKEEGENLNNYLRLTPAPV